VAAAIRLELLSIESAPGGRTLRCVSRISSKRSEERGGQVEELANPKVLCGELELPQEGAIENGRCVFQDLHRVGLAS
jgi:hypothetical protein